MKPRRPFVFAAVSIFCLTLSILTTALMILGGFVSYKPGTFSPDEMQNLYLKRMILFSSISVTLQVAGMLSCIGVYRSMISPQDSDHRMKS